MGTGAVRRVVMALKFKFKSKDEIPAELLSLYAEREGAWVLDVDGAVEKTKLDEFRNTNVALLKERDELKKRFEWIDPDEVRTLADENRRVEEAGQLKAGEVEKAFESRVKVLKSDFDKQIIAVMSERDTLNARLAAIQIDQGVISGTRTQIGSTGGKQVKRDIEFQKPCLPRCEHRRRFA